MINATERLARRVRAAMGDHNNDDLPVTQCVINMRKEVVSLQAECEKLRKDADQYRRLIELGEDFQWENIIRVDISAFPSRADAIDAAMQESTHDNQ